MSQIVQEYVEFKSATGSNARLDRPIVHSYPAARVTVRLEEAQFIVDTSYTVTEDDVRAASKETLSVKEYVAKLKNTSVAALSSLPANATLFEKGDLVIGDQVILPLGEPIAQGKYVDFLNAYITNLTTQSTIGQQSSFSCSLVGWHNVSLLSPILIYLRGRPYDTLANRNIRLGETVDLQNQQSTELQAVKQRQAQALADLDSQKERIVALDGESGFDTIREETKAFYDNAILQLEQLTATNVQQESEGNYVRVFWGVVTNVTKDYASGSETTNLTGTDITYWWSRTTTTLSDALAGSPNQRTVTDLHNRYRNLTSREILTKLLSTALVSDKSEFRFINTSIWHPLRGFKTSVERLPQAKSSIRDEWFNRVDGAFTNFELTIGEEVASRYPFSIDPQLPDSYVPQYKDIWSMVSDVANAVNAEYFFDCVGPTDEIQNDDGTVFRILGQLVVRKPLHAQLEYLKEIENLYAVRSQGGTTGGQKKPVDIVSVNIGEKLIEFADRNNQLVDELRDLNPAIATLESNEILLRKTATGTSGVRSLKIIKGSNDQKLILNDVYKIPDIDVISFSETLNAAGCVTSVQAVGAYRLASGNKIPEVLTSIATNLQLLARFGFNLAEISVLGIQNQNVLDDYAIDWLNINNAQNMHTANLTIVGRPLIKLGTFVKVFNQYWYVNTISHSFGPKERYQTTLGLVAGYAAPIQGGPDQVTTNKTGKEIQRISLILDRFLNQEFSESIFLKQGTIKKLGSVLALDSQGAPISTSNEPRQEKTIVRQDP